MKEKYLEPGVDLISMRSIQNKGYAAPMNPRQAKLVFVADDSTVSEFELGSDPLIPDDPRYSIACANTGVFESATGYNKLLEL